MLTTITRRQAAFAANKVAHIVALGLLYTLIPIRNSIFNFFSKWTVFSERVTFFLLEGFVKSVSMDIFQPMSALLHNSRHSKTIMLMG